MSYPPGPNSGAGYPPAPQGSQYNPPTQQYGQAAADPVPAGPSKLPLYLTAGVAALGLAAYVTTFGLGGTITLGPIVALLAGLLAGVALVPKQTNHVAVTAVLAVLGILIVLADVATASGDLDWPVYLLLAFTAIQAIVAVAALLLDAGLITAPTPKPRYEQQPYGGQSYGQQSYGQYGSQQPQFGGPGQGQPQRPGYPSQYGSYPSNPSTGGFSAPGQQTGPQGSAQGGSQSGAQGGAHPDSPNGPPTPPTGFPAFGQPSQPTQTIPQQSHESSQPHQQPAGQSTQPPS